MKELGRLITAMVTPFDVDGKVDYEQAKKLALACLNSGSDGLVLSGTTGESPTLTHEEELKLYAEIKARSASAARLSQELEATALSKRWRLPGGRNESVWTPVCWLHLTITNPPRKGSISISRPLQKAPNYRVSCIMCHPGRSSVSLLRPPSGSAR